MTRELLEFFYGFDCRVLQKVNNHFDKKLLNLFFRLITRLGGADLTIASTLILILLSSGAAKLTAISSALALSASHIPVHILKEVLPRRRPYVKIEKTKTHENPLRDPSFPSGHTTAIFSVVIPYILYVPHLSFFLIPLAISVGLSRIYLGLHYPSDVLAGALLGTLTGVITFCILCI
ncbi:phosphatase PAP2 family protein [Neobacillus rhizosphaerae]|uniref:phosphatase PAP2 family protein n=1 Tax=Neobacillus rhizosphaerae TaxID=2880965 RepID=UPI003D276A93